MAIQFIITRLYLIIRFVEAVIENENIAISASRYIWNINSETTGIIT